MQFLGDRIPFHRADVVTADGERVGEVPAVELVTIGQRRGLGLPGGAPKRFVLDVDVERAVVVVGDDADLFDGSVTLEQLGWAHEPLATGTDVLVQCSAHGAVRAATFECDASAGARVVWAEPQRRVAPGQSVVLYDLTDTRVLGGGIAGRR